MKLSIIVPVYNEEKTITPLLEKLAKVNLPKIQKEIIIVDDGSTDKTIDILKKQKTKNIKVIFHKKNQGKGVAVKTGIENATGDHVLIQDADLEYDPSDIPSLLKALGNNNAQVVYGTRLKRLPNFRRDERSIRFFIHYAGNKFLSLLTSILYGQWITDMETGYKLFSKKSIHGINFNSKSFDFEPEITAKLLKRNYRIIEVPITTNPRGYSEGKKLNTIKDGMKALFALLKYKVRD